jgi:hypothetical protein
VEDDLLAVGSAQGQSVSTRFNNAARNPLNLKVREFIELSKGHIVTEYLPAYAPELDSVEYICPKDHAELNEHERKASRLVRYKQCLITAFGKQSSLGYGIFTYKERELTICCRLEELSVARHSAWNF